MEISEVDILSRGLTARISNKEKTRIKGFVLQVCLPDSLIEPAKALIKNKPVNFEVWTENGYTSLMIPIDLDPGITDLNICLLNS